MRYRKVIFKRWFAMFIIDRFEGDFAVAEDENGRLVNIKKSLLPSDCGEGSVLRYENGIYIKDTDEEARRRKRIYEKQQSLFE